MAWLHENIEEFRNAVLYDETITAVQEIAMSGLFEEWKCK